MVINLKDPNKDVEETRKLEIVKKALFQSKVEKLCLDLFIEAAEGNSADVMTMLDIFAAKLIHLVAKDRRDVVATHARHINEFLDLIEAVKTSRVEDLLNAMKEKDDENKSNKSN